MEIQFFFTILAIGLFAGVLAGMFGIGGGVVIVPALILFCSFTLTQATGTSLAALLLPVAFFAVLKYYKSGLIDIKIAGLIAFGLLTGVVFGSKLALMMPSSSLKVFYGIFLFYASWSFAKPKEFFKKGKKEKTEEPEQLLPENLMKNPMLFIALGLFAGVLSGLFGIGGGLIIVPFLMAFMKFDVKKAAGTSLAALLLPVGLPGVIVYYNAGDLNIWIAAVVALGIAFGAVFGAKITISLPTLTIKRVYSVFLLIMALNFIWEGL